MKNLINILMLFFSAGTLICCALPALIAAVLGVGSLFYIVDSIPFIVVLSEHKNIIFLTAALLICYNVYNLWWKGQNSCPIDQKEACESVGRFSKIITILASIVVIIGLVFTYL